MSDGTEIYNNEEYCFSEIRTARDAFGNRKTTRTQYEGMLLGLARMCLYCPSDIQAIVYATLLEAKMREPYFESIWKEQSCTK